MGVGVSTCPSLQALEQLATKRPVQDLRALVLGMMVLSRTYYHSVVLVTPPSVVQTIRRMANVFLWHENSADYTPLV